MNQRYLLPLSLALCMGASTAGAQILYQQDFLYDSADGPRPAVTAYNWQLSFSGGAASVTQSGFSANTPTGAVAENQSPAGAFDGGTTGAVYMYYGAANQARSFMLFTSDAGPLDQNISGLAFDWWYGTQSVNGNVRLAVEIDDNWYVSTQAFSSTTATSTAQMETQGLNANVVFDPAAANWADLVFAPGDSFSVSSTFAARGSDLPAGNITAFGFYAYNPNDGNIFGTSIDSVQVIPEPSVAALIAGVGVLGFLVYRRRKS